jgi:hypothetical protein
MRDGSLEEELSQPVNKQVSREKNIRMYVSIKKILV